MNIKAASNVLYGFSLTILFGSIILFIISLLGCVNNYDKGCIKDYGRIKSALINPDTNDTSDKPYIAIIDFWCTGALINPRVVLTAGHCATNKPLNAYVHFIYSGHLVKVKEYHNLGYIYYDGFISKNQKDIGLIVLEADVILDKYPKVQMSYGYADDIIATAYGRAKNKEVFNSIIFSKTGYVSSFNDLYYKSNDVVTNKGDSGGPLMLNNTDIIIGVVTGGDNETSSMYSKTNVAAKEINDVVMSNGGWANADQKVNSCMDGFIYSD